jgi:hypothetical protein
MGFAPVLLDLESPAGGLKISMARQGGIISITSVLHIGGQRADISTSQANDPILDDLIDLPFQHDHELLLRMAMPGEMGVMDH